MKTKAVVDEALRLCGWEDISHQWHWRSPYPRLSLDYRDGYDRDLQVTLPSLQVTESEALSALLLMREEVQRVADLLDAVLAQVAVLQEAEAQMPPQLREEEWDRLIQWAEQQSCE